GFVVFRPQGLGGHSLEWSEIWRIAQQYSMSPAGAYAQILTFLSFTAYGVVMELRFGATVGKLIFKLRVTASEGTRAGLRAVLLRNLVKIVELYWPPLFLLIVLLVALNRNHQRLGDLMGQTAVIDNSATPPEPAESQPADKPPPGPPPSE
ncbi:MAG: RDD family protein, partial [Phycisphaerae bacterium]|nr:RDD family protein [Phycisphaerae bacterium]